MARYQILNATIPDRAIAAFRTLSRARYIEPRVAPRFAAAFEDFLKRVARTTAAQYPKRSGKSAAELPASARVRGSSSLASIRGYYLVSAKIAANEYGARVTPKNSKYLAIPMPAALRADGSPKRLGPRSWKSLRTFTYKSRKTGALYIAYRSGRQGLVLLYKLEEAVKVPAKRTIRNTYDRMLPSLYLSWTQILGEEINLIYSMDFLEELTSFQQRRVPQMPSRIPSAQNYSAGLLPRYN